MERLPRDVASERLHHDIVRLLDSHVAHPNSQAMVPVNNSFMSKSQRNRVSRPLVPLPMNNTQTTTAEVDLELCMFTDSQHIMTAHSNISLPGLKLNNGLGGSAKGKKRPKPSNPTSPPNDSMDSNVSLKRKGSVKKPLPPLPPTAAMSSTAAAPSNKKPFGLDVTGSGNSMDLMALDVSRLYGTGAAGLPQQPPAYEECLSQLPAGSQRPMGANYGAAMHHQQQQQQQQQSDYRVIHQQLLGMQTPQFQEPSPPHSVVMSPSPGKTRPSLPTSPTHMQALRHATMQAVDPFSQFHHFYGGTQQPPQSLQQPQSQQYLTPPSDAAPESFPTPSPDSPWHWSSSSPNSNSDWSESISSPPNNNNNNNNGHPNKVSDAVYI